MELIGSFIDEPLRTDIAHHVFIHLGFVYVVNFGRSAVDDVLLNAGNAVLFVKSAMDRAERVFSALAGFADAVGLEFPLGVFPHFAIYHTAVHSADFA